MERLRPAEPLTLLLEPLPVLLALLLGTAFGRSSADCGFSARVNGLPATASGSLVLMVGDSVELSTGSDEPVDWLLVLPVGDTFWNGTGEGARLGPAAVLCYSVESVIGEGENFGFTAGRTEGLPSLGTFYILIAEGLEQGDTIRTAEPLYDIFPGAAAQLSVRPDDSYTGYLMELMGTPFVMAPRGTPGGRNQADCRLGSDCAGFAVYGKRRQGFDYRYLGPRGILAYLVPLVEGDFRPGSLDGGEGVYRSADGATVATGGEGLHRGDIVHFGVQVSVFLDDRGVPGLLDTSDLLLQCWTGGPCSCTVAESGFTHLPVRVYRWIDDTDTPSITTCQ